MNKQNEAAATYRKNAIMTASPEKIVKLLYDGAIRHMEVSRQELQNEATRRSATVGESLSKAIGIVGELRTSLDHEVDTDITQNLNSLYEYCLDRLSSANIERRSEPVDECLQVMRTLKEGWDAVITN